MFLLTFSCVFFIFNIPDSCSNTNNLDLTRKSFNVPLLMSILRFGEQKKKIKLLELLSKPINLSHKQQLKVKKNSKMCRVKFT